MGTLVGEENVTSSVVVTSPKLTLMATLILKSCRPYMIRLTSQVTGERKCTPVLGKKLYHSHF